MVRCLVRMLCFMLNVEITGTWPVRGNSVKMEDHCVFQVRASSSQFACQASRTSSRGCLHLGVPIPGCQFQSVGLLCAGCTSGIGKPLHAFWACTDDRDDNKHMSILMFIRFTDEQRHVLDVLPKAFTLQLVRFPVLLLVCAQQ